MFHDTIKLILELEGGVADVGDGKGLTRYGQTEGWLREWNLPTPTNQEEAFENYRAWIFKSGLSALLDDDILTKVVVVWAVHSGHQTAIKGLQQSLNVTVDGILGPITKGALSTTNRASTAASILVRYTWFLRGLNSARFEKGWKNRLLRLATEFGLC